MKKSSLSKMASRRALVSSIFFILGFSISTILADIYKVGDVISVTCPMTWAEDEPEQNTNWIPEFVRRPEPADGTSILIVYPGRTENSEKNCNPASDVCNAMRARTVVNETTLNGLDARKFSYTLTAADASHAFTCEAMEPTYRLPRGSSPDSKIITIVDPSTLQIDVDVNATSIGVEAGEQLVASCKVPKNGPGNLELVMRIAGEELMGLSVTSTETEVSITTAASHLAKKEHNGQPIDCFIKVDGNQWGDAKSSAALNVLFAPQIIPPKELTIYVEKEENVIPQKVVNCSATAGNPAGFNWSVLVKDKGTDNVRTDVIAKEDGKDQATYYATVRVDGNLEVECIVKNAIGSTSAKIDIEVITKPKISGIEIRKDGAVLPMPIDLKSERKMEVKMVCVATPSKATIAWFKRVNGNQSAITEGVTGKELTVELTHDQDGHIYGCIASVLNQPDATEVKTLTLIYDIKVEVSEEIVAEPEGKRITFTADGKPDVTKGLQDTKMKVAAGDYFKEVPAVMDGTKKATFTVNIDKDNLNKTYTFTIEQRLDDGSQEQLWVSTRIVEALPPPEPTTPPTAVGSGAVAGIIIAVILVVLCAILLVVMWRKGLLCASPPAKGGVSNAPPSTAASTAGALDNAELGYAEDLNAPPPPPNGGIVNPAGPVNNGMNGYAPPPENHDNFYTPVVRQPTVQMEEGNVDYTAYNPEENVGGGGEIGGETDVENNVQPPVKDADRMSDDSGVERNGHLPPETGV